MKLDPWQQEIQDYEGHILLGKGRRIGATHAFGQKAVEHLVKHHNSHPSSQIVCVSLTADQAQLIIAFATNYAKEKYPKYMGRGANKPTLNRLILVVKGNRRILLSRPVGTTGDAARGFEGQVLMVDEASRMPKSFWSAAKPILATTGGKIWMWSTFFGTKEYFWKSFDKSYNKKDKKSRFKVWLKSTEEVFENRPISKSWTKEQRKEALQFLEDEKEDMSRLEYAQEYLAIASDEIRQFFNDDLIRSRMVLTREKICIGKDNKFLGVDVARMGEDESVLFSVERIKRIRLKQIDMKITKKTSITSTARLCKDYDRRYTYKKMYIDSGGVGGGVYDILRDDPQTKRKAVEINNASRSTDYDPDKDKRVKILKEDLYNNMLKLMEEGKIELFNEPEIFLSFKSIQYEYTDAGRIRIFGKNSHIVEAANRAVWCMKDKSLNIYISC